MISKDIYLKKEFDSIFFNDELVKINDLINQILATSYLYNFSSNRFEFNYKKFQRLNIKIGDHQNSILSKNIDLRLIINELHNDFLENKLNNMNVQNFVDWTSSLMKKGFQEQEGLKPETLTIIYKVFPSINKDIYKEYSNIYRDALIKANEKAILSCKNKVKHKELELKINKADDKNLFKKLPDDNTNRIFYINSICAQLKLDKDDIYEITYEIYTLNELDTVLAAVEGSQWIKDLPKKDPKHELRNTRGKLDNAKDKLISTLIELGMKEEAQLIREKVNYRKTFYSRGKYEDEKKDQKKILYDSLISYCNTSQSRAKQIIKIIDFIN